MAERTNSDMRLETLKHRPQEDLVDEHGRPAEPDDIESVVDAKAERLAEAPVQEFVPLLIEHQARDELRQHGLHRDFDEDNNAVASDNVNDRSDRAGMRTDPTSIQPARTDLADT